MDIERLYNKLYHDVYIYFYPDIHLLNQEGDVNQFNTFNKKGWKYFLDGGRIIKATKNYNCSYDFDFKDNENLSKRILRFCSYNEPSGVNLLDFIKSVLNGDPKIFVKSENLICYDSKKYLFEVISIYVNDSVIDEMFFQVLKRYFHKVEKIRFNNCIIKRECNLNNVNAYIELDHTIIENCRSLNDCKSDIYMIRSSISQISPTTIQSQKLTISCLSLKHYVDLKMLFLKCNFPNLISFKVDPETHYDTYSFEDAFTYLPYSAPNLEKIIIEGKVKNLNFLTKFKYLINCSVLSIYDDSSLRYANITDKKEREKIFERNKSLYEIKKILFPSLEDKYIITDLEEERILRLCHFLSTLSYTEEDKRVFTEKDIIKVLVSKTIDHNIEYYYECYYDTLRLKRQKAEEIYLNYNKMYRFFGKYLCIYDPVKELFQKNKNQILQTKSYMFSSNGIPIVFKENVKPIRTMEEAKKKMSKVKNTEINVSDYEYQSFIEFLKKYSKEMKEPILVDDFIYLISEQLCYSVKGQDFLTFGSAGKRISYAFDANQRSYKRIYDIRYKVDRYKKLLVGTINDNYESFTIEEKAYIYCDKFDMRISQTKEQKEKFKTFYDILITDEESTLRSINLKTNGLYSKYRNYIRGFTKPEYSFINPYNNVYVTQEDMKQLKLHL